MPDQYELTRFHLPFVPPKYKLAQPLPSRFVVVIVRVAVVSEPVPGLVLLGAVHEVVPILVFHLHAPVILCAFAAARSTSTTTELVEQRRHPPGYGCWPRPSPPLVHLPAQFSRSLLLLLGIRQRPAVRRRGEVSRLLLRTVPPGIDARVQTEHARPARKYLGGSVGSSPVYRRFVRGGGVGSV